MTKQCENCQHGKKVVEPAIYQCQRNKKTVMYNYSCSLWQPKAPDVMDFFNGIFKGKGNGRPV